MIGALTAWVYGTYGKNAKKGNNLIIERTEGPVEVPLRMAVLTFCFTILSHLFGGSVGREGTAVQIGGTVTSTLARRAGLSEAEHRLLVHAGISAGFGAVFGTPLAGACFGMEVCAIGRLPYSAALPCLWSAYLADWTARFLGTTHAQHAIAALPVPSIKTLCAVVFSAVLFGLAGRAFAGLTARIKVFYAKFLRHPVWIGFVGALIVMLAMLLLGLTRYAGLSAWMMDAGFAGQSSFTDPICKLALTSLSLGAGLQGGEVTPLFDIGASLGGALGGLLGIEPSFLAALGMITVFGSAVNTPLATILLGIELFGTQAAPYYAAAAYIGYFVMGHRGIYASQRIAYPKRIGLAADIGKQLGEL